MIKINTIKKNKEDMVFRGQRIKNIRENELHMTKTKLASELGVSSQFLGLVEEGKGNLMYGSIKKLREVSGHSADFILYGLDDEIISKTKYSLQQYSEIELINAIDALKRVAFFIRNH